MKTISATGSAIGQAVECLKAGGTVIHATETCYGIACDLTNSAAVRQLFAVKQRPHDQPVSALFSSVEEAKKFVVFSDKALDIAEKYLPGPLTLVFPRKENPPFPLYVCPPSFSILNSQFRSAFASPPIPSPSVSPLSSANRSQRRPPICTGSRIRTIPSCNSDNGREY